MAEVNCLIKDGLKIRGITVESAIRKSNNSGESKPGIIIAKFKSKDEMSTVMKSKNKLKDSRRYSKVFLEHDLPRHQRMLNANIRTIVKTLGRQELEFDGTRVKVKDSYSDRGQREQSDFSSETVEIAVTGITFVGKDDIGGKGREVREGAIRHIQKGDVKIIMIDEQMNGIGRGMAITTESVRIMNMKGQIITGVGVQGMSIDHTRKAEIMETRQDNN